MIGYLELDTFTNETFYVICLLNVFAELFKYRLVLSIKTRIEDYKDTYKNGLVSLVSIDLAKNPYNIAQS